MPIGVFITVISFIWLYIIIWVVVAIYEAIKEGKNEKYSTHYSYSDYTAEHQIIRIGRYTYIL